MITSSHNPKIQWVRKLQAQPAARREDQAFVIEGVRLCEEAIHSGWQPQLLLFSDGLSERGWALVQRCQAEGVNVEQATPEALESASETRTPQGVLAVLPVRELPFPSTPDFVLILDNLRDPGNLGTILRTAAAAGVQAALLTPGTADPFAPKVVRSAMGAHFRLPIYSWTWEIIQAKLALDTPQPAVKAYLADSGGGLPYTQVDFNGPLALVIGGEAEGAGLQAQELAAERVHIPMPGAFESLNAASAAAILIFEVVRQRQ